MILNYLILCMYQYYVPEFSVKRLEYNLQYFKTEPPIIIYEFVDSIHEGNPLTHTRKRVMRHVPGFKYDNRGQTKTPNFFTDIDILCEYLINSYMTPALPATRTYVVTCLR